MRCWLLIIFPIEKQEAMQDDDLQNSNNISPKKSTHLGAEEFPQNVILTVTYLTKVRTM